MKTLTIEPTYRVVLGETDVFRLLLVGVGGTGSTLAGFLAGLMYHAREKGIAVELTLVDPDVIKLANVGRQAFAPVEAQSGDLNKAASLALRLNAAYGLDIAAWPVAFDAEMGARWFHQSRRGQTGQHLIIGCVDTYIGRRAIAETVDAGNGRIWALDCGNERVNGQVLMGNMTAVDQIQLDSLGLCSGLPSPYLQESDLLEPPPEPAALSCAGLALAGEQSLMINRLVAAVAAQYVTDFVLQRTVSQMGTFFSLAPTVMTPRPITAPSLARLRSLAESAPV